MLWRLASLMAVAGATAILMAPRRVSPRILQSEPALPESLERWESEGGNVPVGDGSEEHAQ
jgi:hypothetical protein